MAMLVDAEEQVARMVMKFFQTQQNPKERLVVVADVDDPCGAEIADVTLPGFDWDTIRSKGMQPIAIGTMPHELLVDFARGTVLLSELVPDHEDTVLVAVVAHGGIMVAEIEVSAGPPSARMN